MQFSLRLQRSLLLPLALTTLTLASLPAKAQTPVYSPIPLPASREVNDTLSDRDIPTGTGGFARDYTVNLEAGDQVAIDVTSDEFDTLVILMNKDGVTVGENDDGPDGTTNSLLFARITESGSYTVRVRAYAGQGTGRFYLKVARLREVQ
ncbi:PPC domain-containing protein [Nodosilinea sp. PGN35]|uniref:PPC domain-containing protein n=1 Tax=Nodosilinea sp. PGN35 TaxID=3020489 RepID=UPI0023B2E872|nr:PPC domain-containing protein [Nodosilinea sp. TSF1-S3]MDF0366608.1 PPC domain-containing protein [Nodosilinea sp. TSF1-S3]